MGCYGAITQLPPNNGYEIVDPNYKVQHRGDWHDNYVTVCGKERRDYFSYRIVGFFLSKGLTINEACAIAGNASCEGGFCGGAQNWMKDGSGESFGMFAFYNGGVFPRFKEWCDKNNRKYWFIDSILDFLWYFMSNGVTSQGKQLKDFFLSDTGKNATIEECSLKWACIFERCGAKKLPNGGYTYACCDSKRGRNPERAKSSREIKSKVLNYKYFTQNGECTTTETTSNIDSSSETTYTSNMSESCNKLINGISALRGGHTPQSTDAIDSYLQSLLESPTSETVSVSTNENNNEIKIELNEWACIGGGHEIEGVKSVLFECFRTDDDIVKHIDEFYKLPYKLKTFSLGSKINCKYLIFSIPWTYYVEFFEKIASILGDKDPGSQNTYKQDHKSRFKGAFKNFSRLLYNTCYSDFIRNNITYKYMYILPSAVTSMDIKRTLCSKLRKDKPGHNYLCYDFVDNKDFLRYMYDIIEHAILEIVSKGFKSYLIVSDDYNLYTKEHSEDLKKNMIITRNTIQKAGRLQDQPKLNCIGNGCKDASEEAYNKKFENLLKLFNPLYK